MLVAIPSKEFLDKIPAQDLDQLAQDLDGKAKIMIATSAFGHGVDYDQVRHILFFGLPYSLEDFGQQSGRAGRDGKLSYSLLFLMQGRNNSRWTI